MIELSLGDLLWAAGLMAIAIGLSAWQQLEITSSLAMATARTTIQLLAVGYVLAIVFSLDSPWAVVGVTLVMLTISAIVARNRISKRFPRLLPLVWGSILISTVLTLGYVTLLVIRPPVWYEPQYLVPLAGMVLGNAMNSSAIAGERLLSTVKNSRVEIETHLSLGATPQQAIATYRRDAIKAGLIPITNAMMVVGMVTLPGIITGQLLSGINPFLASLYQMLIMFMLAFANLLAALLVTWGIYRQCFNRAAQLIVVE
ncbi:ABC transporter permease [Trichothermofontia sp.]